MLFPQFWMNFDCVKPSGRYIPLDLHIEKPCIHVSQSTRWLFSQKYKLTDFVMQKKCPLYETQIELIFTYIILINLGFQELRMSLADWKIQFTSVQLFLFSCWFNILVAGYKNSTSTRRENQQTKTRAKAGQKRSETQQYI
jgi:hypothetical protein